jgi:plastocyanin
MLSEFSMLIQTMMCRWSGVRLVGAILTTAGLGCALGAAGLAWSAYAAAESQVKIDNFTFGPDTLTVPAGTTITFNNDDDIPHTVVATDKSFRSQALDTGDSFAVTLTKAGVINYFCSLHPRMTGKIVVTQ